MDDVRVVVVDDYADAAEVLAARLQLYGYSVQVALDGREALAIVESFRPHCILLDIGMPGIDGDELSKQLRERFGDDIVLIAVTGRSPHDRAVAATFARVDHYLQKPVSEAELRRVLPPVDS